MAATEDRDTLGRARLSFAKQQDVDEFVDTLDKFERGEIRPTRGARSGSSAAPTGSASRRRVDAARQDSAGRPRRERSSTPLADVAEQYSRGFGHITTRQNMQFHFVPLHEAEAAMRRLAEAGLTTREACGNSVRNITACPYAGVAADEPFDVTPYAEALTRYFLRHPLSATLPRKFKIAFEGCPHDHIGFRSTTSAGAPPCAIAKARPERGLPRHRRRAAPPR